MGGISVLVLIGFLTSIYILWILFLVCLTFYLLNDYIFESIFIYKVSKSKLAFIPIYNKIILGKTFHENKLGFGIFLTDLLSLIFLILSLTITTNYDTLIFISIIFLLILSFILNTIMSHLIIKKYVKKYVDIITIINVFTLGIIRPITYFLIRNRGIHE